MVKHILLLLDGEEPAREIIAEYASHADIIAATDGAASYARHNQISVDVILGDMDSIDSESKEYFLSHHSNFIENADQETNDFEKALQYLSSNYPDSKITVLGIHGKRTDHLLVNFSVMLRYTDSFETLEAVDVFHTHRFLTTMKNQISIARPMPTSVTLLAFSPTSGITTKGLKYALDDADMEFGKREGLSNVVVSSEGAVVSIRQGSLLVSVAL